MVKRISLLLLGALLATFALTACSTESGPLNGDAAYEAMRVDVKNSVAKMTTEGGSETLAVGKTQYAIIYDPTAPDGKQVVTANLTDESPATFETTETVSLLALERLIYTGLVTKADVTFDKGVYSVQGSDFLFEIFVADGLVYKSNIWSSTSGSQEPQVVVITYGISTDSQKLFDSAIDATPAK